MNDLSPNPAPEKRAKLDKLRRIQKRESIRGDWDTLFDDPIPAALETPYVLDAEGEARNRTIMAKYAGRAKNTRRAFNRLQRFLPDLLIPGTEPLDVFELSTAHGAILEVARHHGHRVLGNDFANMIYARKSQDVATTRGLNDDSFKREVDDWGFEITDDPEAQDWPYRHLIEAQQIPMKIFDCGHLPYPLEDKAVDMTLCLQAIEHYCHPDHWADVVAEMCRISRRTVFILLNPMHPRFGKVEGYEAAFETARLALRVHNAHGFRTTAVHMHWGQALGFRLDAV